MPNADVDNTTQASSVNGAVTSWLFYREAMLLDLYHHPRFVSFASVIALEEVEADFRCTLVDFSRDEQRSAAYLAINPCGQVPALRIADGIILTETISIFTYLGQVFSHKALLPPPGVPSLQWIGMACRMATTYHPAFTAVVRPDLYASDRSAQLEVQKYARQKYRRCLKELDQRLLISEWLCGDQFTLVDAYAFVLYQWAVRADFDTIDLPSLSDFARRMGMRPAVVRALAREARWEEEINGRQAAPK